MEYAYEIVNWRHYQHYRDRNPPWVKLHFALLSSEDWVMASDRTRVLMVACMLIASQHDGRIPANPDYMKRVAYLHSSPDFNELVSLGFLIDLRDTLADASTVLADASISVSDSDSDSSLSSKAGKKEEEVHARGEIEEKVTEVIEYFRQATGKRQVKVKASSNRSLIRARLKEDISVDQMRSIIDLKIKDAASDTVKFDEKYLRIQTLFSGEGCQKYLAELDSAKPVKPAKTIYEIEEERQRRREEEFDQQAGGTN